MPTRIKPEIGEYYHIYNRGIEKKSIFLDAADRNRFLRLLYLCNGSRPVITKLQGLTLDGVDRGSQITNICVYCLMPNHFHILFRETTENGISTFMQKLTTGYTMYFNKKYERSGSLFQGTYKSRPANTDAYLKYLISYIHLNPVKIIDPSWKENGIFDRQKAEKFLHSYHYSSYQDFLGQQRPENNIISQQSLPEYFTSTSDFKATIRDWLEYKSPYSKV